MCYLLISLHLLTMQEHAGNSAIKSNINLHSYTLPEKMQRHGGFSNLDVQTRQGSQIYQQNSMFHGQQPKQKQGSNAKIIICKSFIIAMVITFLYSSILFKRLDKHKLDNLVPNIPYIFSYNASRYQLYPMFYGYDVYQCDDITHLQDQIIQQQIFVYFTPQYTAFKFRVMGYTTFSIDITDEKGKKITNEILLFQDDQRQSVRYFSCTNMICQFEIQSRLPELKITITLSTTNIDKTACKKLERKVQKDVFQTLQNNYWYYECENSRLTVLIPQEQQIQNCSEALHNENTKGTKTWQQYFANQQFIDITTEQSEMMSGINDQSLYQWGQHNNNQIQIYRYYKIDGQFQAILCFIVFVTSFNIILMVEVNR